MDDENINRQMLLMLAQDLKKTQRILAEAYLQRDQKVLRAELHRCLGGVLFLRLPQLESLLKAFQKALKSKPQDQQYLDIIYETLQREMGKFCLSYEE